MAEGIQQGVYGREYTAGSIRQGVKSREYTAGSIRPKRPQTRQYSSS